MLELQQVPNKKPRDEAGTKSQGGYGGKVHTNSTANSESKSMRSRVVIQREGFRGAF
jgi:hypothetical protein